MTPEPYRSAPGEPLQTEGRTVYEVLASLTAILRSEDLCDQGEGLHLYSGLPRGWEHRPWPIDAPWGGVPLPWPEQKEHEYDFDGPRPAAWIACFAIRGDSEGWYVHVEAIWRSRRKDAGASILLALGKEWSAEQALKVANRCAVLLGAV